MNTLNDQPYIQTGTVVEASPNQSLVRVNVLGRTTDWLPVLQQANRFKKQFVSLRVDEQVVVLADRCVIRGMFNKQEKEPTSSNDHVDITEYEDGTQMIYDTQEKALTIKAVGTVNIIADTVNVQGAQGDVVVNGVSLVNHTHPQNSGDHFGGGASTQKPTST